MSIMRKSEYFYNFTFYSNTSSIIVIIYSAIYFSPDKIHLDTNHYKFMKQVKETPCLNQKVKNTIPDQRSLVIFSKYKELERKTRAYAMQ